MVVDLDPAQEGPGGGRPAKSPAVIDKADGLVEQLSGLSVAARAAKGRRPDLARSCTAALAMASQWSPGPTTASA